MVLTDEALDALAPAITAAFGRGLGLNTLLTGAGQLALGRVAYHPPLESELQDLKGTIVVAVDNSEVLIGSTELQDKRVATVTRNADIVMIARQFVWMEMFTQRIYSRLGADLLAALDLEDREIFASRKGG